MRLLAGALLAAIIALAARRTRSLSTSGAVAAIVTGTLAVGAGWSWGVVLILYFAASTVLSHLGRREKERRTASIVAKGGERDAFQVLANGFAFAVAAGGFMLTPHPLWLALGAGSLAASAADTWATEIGTLYGGTPRSILTLRRVPAGTSGGISVAGLLASAAGATFVSLAARTGWPIVVGGIAGALIDSLLGATIQSRRWCDACARETERPVHDCGAATRPLCGVSWIDNDVVNFLSGTAGGLLAAVLSG